MYFLDGMSLSGAQIENVRAGIDLLTSLSGGFAFGSLLFGHPANYGLDHSQSGIRWHRVGDRPKGCSKSSKHVFGYAFQHWRPAGFFRFKLIFPEWEIFMAQARGRDFEFINRLLYLGHLFASVCKQRSSVFC